MAGGGAIQHPGLSWWQGITRYQWTVLMVAWFGFMFDLMDSTLYSLVMVPAVRDLLGQVAQIRVELPLLDHRQLELPFNSLESFFRGHVDGNCTTCL